MKSNKVIYSLFFSICMSISFGVSFSMRSVFDISTTFLESQLNSGLTKNLVFSSSGLFSLLGMIQIGAKEETKMRLFNTTKVDFTALNYIDECEPSPILEIIESRTDESVERKNKLYSKEQIKGEYLKKLDLFFKGEYQTLDFSKNVESVNIMNNWVKDATKGKITKLFKPNDVDSMTEMVFINTLYFKSKWLNKFDERVSEKNEFFKVDGTKIEALFMERKMSVMMRNTENFSICALPYSDSRYIGVFVLPNEGSNLKEVVKLEVLFGQIDSMSTLSKTEVFVKVPKIKISSEFDLNEFLIKEYNLSILFNSSKANLRGITDQVDLQVSKIIQSATIELDEEGTVAAAATRADKKIRSATRRLNTEFICNRPYMFYVWDIKNHIPLFSAIIVDPNII